MSRTPLVDSLVTGDREYVGGVLCNDPSGLCLVAKGALNDPEREKESGVYTNLVQLASQLRPREAAAEASPAPLITIETDTSAILIKEYDGHAVAVRVPMKETSGLATSPNS